MKNKKWIFIILTIIIAVISIYFIIKTYGATGIANTKNEEALVRLVAAKAMAQNSDRSVTLVQVKTAMESYVSSSSIAVTEDTSAVYVKYNSTGNTYTIYKGPTYTVTYNANGGSGAPASQTNKQGVPLTLSSVIPTRSGYTFLGWAESSAATSAKYQPGDEYTEDVSLELYAVWNENYLTVNYYSNYATSAFSGAPTVSASTNVIVRTHKFYYNTAYSTGLHNYSASGNGTYLARTGYTATGKWGTTTSGGTLVDEDTSFANGQALAQAFGKDLSSSSQSINVYAQWEATNKVLFADGVVASELGGFKVAGTQVGTNFPIIENNYIYTKITQQSGYNSETDAGFANPIDMTNYDTLYALVDYSFPAWSRAIGLQVGTTFGAIDEGYTLTYDGVYDGAPSSTGTQKTISIDISSLSGSYYVSWMGGTSPNSPWIKHYKIWME